MLLAYTNFNGYLPTEPLILPCPLTEPWEIGISTLIDSPYTTTKNTAAVAINGINTEKSIELDQKDWINAGIAPP